MDTESGLGRALQPLWVAGYQRIPSHPHTASSVAPSPTISVRSSSPASSPAGFPSPIHPAPLGNDEAMRQHERALVDRLDRRPSPAQKTSQYIGQPPALISEHAVHHSQLSMTSPTTVDARSPYAVVPEALPRSWSCIPREETGPTIRPGVHDSQQDGVYAPVARPLSLSVASPSAESAIRHKNSLVRRRVLQILVTAVPLSKPGRPHSGDDENKARDKKTQTPDRAEIFVKVHPCDPRRPPLVLKRRYNMEKLRHTGQDSLLSSAVSSPKSPSSPTHLDERTSLPTQQLSRAEAKSVTTPQPDVPKALMHGENTVFIRE